MSELLERRAYPSPPPPVEFSIVIPTYGRHESVERLVESLARLDYPAGQCEVIIVDDGSPVPAEMRLARFRDRLDLILLRQDNAGPARARNYGASLARGKFIALTDDDCTATAGWLKNLARALEGAEHAVCGGKTVNHLAGNLYAEATQVLVDYLYRYYNPIETPGAFFPTNNFAVPREAFLDLGGFDETLRFGEDRDFCYRWASRGYAFVSAPEAIIRHAHALNFVSFLRLHFSYGGGTYHFRRKSGKAGFQPVKVSPPRWYLNLVLSGARQHGGLRGVKLTILLAASQVASALGMFWEMVRRRGGIPRKRRELRPCPPPERYSPDQT